METKTTITISVNIASDNKYEGDAEFRLTLPEKHIKYIDRNKLANELDNLISEAMAKYTAKNS